MRVGIVMGSDSDEQVMRGAAEALDELAIKWEIRVLSAHRTPDDTISYARKAADRGLGVIIAGAGGAAHLAGVIAASTTLPVIGVPIALAKLDGLDSLLSMVQMPRYPRGNRCYRRRPQRRPTGGADPGARRRWAPGRTCRTGRAACRGSSSTRPGASGATRSRLSQDGVGPGSAPSL